MSGYAFDTAIVIDVLAGHAPARSELHRVLSQGARPWVSRLTWAEVLSYATPACLRDAEIFMSGFSIDEVDEEIAVRAASLRRERPSLALLDATVLATAMTRGRVLVTRNTNDFPAAMPGIRIPYTL
jgi:predicted nucleic acid-binding protein